MHHGDCIIAPLIFGFAFHSFSYPQSTTAQKLMILLTYGQKVNSSLTLHHNTYVIHFASSHYIGILSSHIFKRRVNIVQ